MTNYCGCCGLVNNSGDDHFCRPCWTHVLPATRPAEERTWFAQFRTDCPFAREPINP